MSEHSFLYRCNFGSFVDFAFRELHPGETMDDNWHIRLMANILQFSWADPNTMRKMIFNLPPGSLKTHICSISLPAWILGRDPRQSVLIVSETPDQALEIRETCAELMSTKRYRQIFPRARIIRSGKDLELSYGGRIRSAGVGYSLPHRRSDLVVIDNPQSLHNLNRLDPASFIEIGRTLRKPKEGMIAMATRRLGENDLSNYLYQLGGWPVFSMPAVALNERRWDFPPDDRHVQLRGEPLHRWRMGWDEIEKELFEVGGTAFCWQYLQGEYTPQTTGQRPGVDSQGNPVLMIGSFDPNWVVSDDLAKLKQDYLANLSL